MNEFPNYPTWVKMLAFRDVGIVNITVLVVIALVYLLSGKYMFQRWMPYIRVGCLIVFYAAAIYKVVEGLHLL